MCGGVHATAYERSKDSSVESFLLTPLRVFWDAAEVARVAQHNPSIPFHQQSLRLPSWCPYCLVLVLCV